MRTEITQRLALVLVVLAAVAWVAFAKVRYTESDPHGTLLLSQSIVQQGTLRLDRYSEELVPLQPTGGHVYYYFPFLTSLLSAPFVALANAFGMDMRDYDKPMQIVMVCMTTALSVFALFHLAALLVSRRVALVLSAVFWAGTSMSSTGGTALWSHNFAAVLALLGTYLAVRSAQSASWRTWPLLATVAFLTYLCRPTMALFAVFLLAYIACHDRQAALRSAGLLGLLLAGFVAFNMALLGQPLPEYYVPGRLDGNLSITALTGNLVSPARGILVYSPFLLPALGCAAARARRDHSQRALLLLAIVWPLVHLLAISKFPAWWAGDAYGARYLFDVLPGLFLLCAYAWPMLAGRSRVFRAGVALSAAFAVYVNAWQGLYNPYTKAWNDEPIKVDIYQEYLFDWRYPQFLHNARRHEERLRDFAVHTIGPSSPGATFAGWSAPRRWLRWSTSHTPRIVLEGPRQVRLGELSLRYCTLGQQRVQIRLNGTIVSDLVHEDAGPSDEETIFYANERVLHVRFSPLLIKEDRNIIDLWLPDARRPGGTDPRTLGLCFFYLTLR